MKIQAAHHTRNGGIDAAVSKIFLGNIKLALGLRYLALHFHPFHIGERPRFVYLPEALQGILRLVVLCLRGCHQTFCLRLVEFGNELPLADGLSFFNAHALQGAAPHEADGGGCVFFYDAYIVLLQIGLRWGGFLYADAEGN